MDLKILVPTVALPVLVPLLRDLFACICISIMNRAKGRPTWRVGTRFGVMVWPNGYARENLVITNVTFKYVEVSTGLEVFVIKKRDMLKMCCSCVR